MVQRRKKRFPRNRYLGASTFAATLLVAGMHQNFVLDPLAVSMKARRVATFVTGDLQMQLNPAPSKGKLQKVSMGIDALLQEKLQSLLADSQLLPPPSSPLPITHVAHPYFQEFIPR